MDTLRPVIGDDNVKLWLRPVDPVGVENGKLLLKVPNDFFVQWISKNYRSKIEDAFKAASGVAVTVDLSIAKGGPLLPPAAPPPASSSQQELAFSDLNPRYTFDTFVVGQHNRFAYAMAEQVSKNPGERNPFFIYGGVGLGKTHLMVAIGHAMRRQHPRARVLYTTAEQFVNEYINSLAARSTDDFRGKYRYLDCLLIDDIQFLIAKEQSEQEFFHTFNTLYETRKQVVICSDRAPTEMTPYEQRLISRFQWGVQADIKAPDLETRIAILRKKGEADKIFVPDDVILFIASSIKSNIRELEGAVTTVSSYAQVTGAHPTVDLVRELLKIGPEAAAPVRVESIQKVVAQKHGLEVRDLKSDSRTNEVAFPRQLAMYLASMMTEMSLQRIGAAFGGRDHTTVLHARKKIARRIDTDAIFAESVNKLMEQVRAVDAL